MKRFKMVVMILFVTLFVTLFVSTLKVSAGTMSIDTDAPRGELGQRQVLQLKITGVNRL